MKVKDLHSESGLEHQLAVTLSYAGAAIATYEFSNLADANTFLMQIVESARRNPDIELKAYIALEARVEVPKTDGAGVALMPE